MPTVATKITFAERTVIKADPTLYPQAAGRANGYFCPLGPEPGIGYVLLTRNQWNAIAGQRNASFPLRMESGGISITFPALYIVSAVKVSGGPAGDPNSVYMLKLADRRWHARMSDVAVQFNVRCPAPPATSGDDLYYEDSLNSGSAWTWETACENLWNAIPGFGAWPGLPVAPTSNPEGFHFVGVPAIDALCKLLAVIDCELAYLPTIDTAVIVESGSVQPGLSSALQANAFYLVDAEPFDVPAALVPETVRVYFHRRDEHYGTEKLTQQASGNWVTESWYSVDVATNVSGTVSGTVVPVWDDLPAVYDFDGSLTNSSALNTRAALRAEGLVGDRQRGSARRRTLYSGVVSSIQPGSEIKAVHWRCVDARHNAEGLVTEIRNHPGYAKHPESGSGFEPEGMGSGTAGEALAPADLARHTAPNFPPLLQLVAVDGSGGALTAPVSGDRVWEGHVYRTNPAGSFSSVDDPYEAAETCWICLVNRLTGGHVSDMTLPAGDRYLGRLTGTYSQTTSAVVDLDDTVSAGANSEVTLPNGETVTAHNNGEEGLEAGAARVTLNMGVYELAAAEGGDEVGDVLTSDIRPLYEVIRPENVISPVTLDDPLAVGASVDVTLSDGRTVNGENQTAVILPAGAATAYLDMATSTWKITASVVDTGGGGGGVDMYEARLNGDLASTDANATIDGATNIDTGATPAITSARNPFELHGADNDRCFIVNTAALGPPAYLLLAVVPNLPEVARIIEGYVYHDFTFDDATFRMRIQRAYNGVWPKDSNGDNLDTIMVRNVDREGIDLQMRGPYLFEGEFGGQCRAFYNPEASDAAIEHIYNADFVECPEESPVETESPSAHGFKAYDLYSQGGLSDQAITANYYGD